MAAGDSDSATAAGEYTSVDVTAGNPPSVIAAAPGHIYNVLAGESGPAAVVLYDNASAASGPVLLTIPAWTNPGTSYRVETDTANGIYAATGPGSPPLTITFR